MNDYSDVGVIYILTNKAFSNLVKIGYADDLIRRVNQLNSSDALPYPFEIYAYYGVPRRLTDLKLHNLIDKLNPSLRTRSEVNGRTRVREFFELTPEDAFSILDAIAEITDTKKHLILCNSNNDWKNNAYSNSFRMLEQIASADTFEGHCDSRVETQIFTIVNSKILAKMKVNNNSYIVLKGSQLQFPNSPSMQESLVNLRAELERQNKISIVGDIGTLLVDVPFTSPSAAAKFVCGNSRNGWELWLDCQGNALENYRKKNFEQDDRRAGLDNNDIMPQRTVLQKPLSNRVGIQCSVNNIENQLFSFVSTKIVAYMKYIDKKYIVLKGAQLQYPNSPVLQPSILKLRNLLEKQNKIVVSDDVGILMEDVYFTSASAAAKFVCGSSRDGWVAWKDSEGNILDAYRNLI